MHPRRLWALLACFAFAGIAAAQTPLTYEEALARARARAPRILLAKDRIEEARGRLRGASVFIQFNPEVDLAAGPRRSTTANTVDYEFGASQRFELGGQRGARIAGAMAEVEQATAVSRNAARELLRDVAFAYWRAVAARDRALLATAADGVASELLRSMERRLEAGDVPQLEVNVARISAARTRAELRSAEADSIGALGDLRIFLGMRPEDAVQVAGELGSSRPYVVEELIAAATDRPDLRALSAEIRKAESEVRLGRAQTVPDVGIGVRHERDEGDNITKAGVSITLPVFSRGQELRAVGTARAARLTRELEATKLAVANEVRTAFDVYERKQQAASDLARTAIPTVNENESLARRSFDEGELNLIELLLIRREGLETRLLHVNQQLEAAIAAVELEARAGVLQ